MEKTEKLTLQQLSEELGISKERCRQGIIDGLLPFAVCLPPRNIDGKFVFLILRSRFEAWKGGQFTG